ncbi:M3 family metallopeptidase [Porphyromonas circumdentaria]|uniref:Dipeptidyl carboxypeptidase n=1 Tax=Porphyromonas circumdentaria TaxID=29524 RepID=A0A1T4L8S7_9PORP|nr:M3 family metallopeptidase [Porphyromonas circumdentaria]MBB6275363.1 peptidyl-dipeptidase Dcp [Porphyromonas circumdentaria]MDO4721856.1 M3 family metallopeptidase [Porphyromonas circumdentaria]SJZ50897.1 peptidyl-dipeptidase Dcp . Metallo peptidase. MEROPS family M03A [Porphyromonas circumdentaria]
MFKRFIPAIVAVTTMMTACNGGKDTSQQDLSSNPFINPSETYMHTPDFSKIKVEHFRPAFEEGMRIHTEEIEAISNNPEAPTFENTLVALEKSGQVLSRVSSVFFALSSADTNDDLIAIEEEIAPKLAEHSDAMYLNDKLFGRIKVIYEGDQSTLDTEDKRLIKFYYDQFVQKGALLNPEQKETLKKINQEEASLLTDFGNKLTKATNALLFIKDKEQLQGLSEEELNAAAAKATDAKHPGEYAFSLDNTTQQSIMAKLDVRETRKFFFEASINRCMKGDEFDTQAIVKRLAELRAEKAALLGFNSYAAWKLQDQLAATPEKVTEFLSNLAKLAMPRALAEEKELEDFARQTEGANFDLEAWDWSYFAEKLRREKYGIDEATIRRYFVLDNVLYNGVFYSANQLYGISFKPRTDVSVYHEDVRVWDVLDKEGNVFALFYFDPYARASKSGGAWMSNFVDQSYLLERKPVIYNVCNYTKPAQGEPCLLSWDEVTTLFHEFGHALHGLFASQKYPSLSGTSVPRDFVEMPSQFNEHWAAEPSVFANYAKHYKTGEAMPKELVEKLQKAQTFNQSYPMIENVAACLLDQAWHSLTVENAKVTDVKAFQEEQLSKVGLLNKCIPPRYGSSYFRHIWSNGYSAGYYAYLWSEALDNDIYAWFEKNGGLTFENGSRLRSMILSKGNTEDLMSLFTEFTGHKEVDLKPLLKARGLL